MQYNMILAENNSTQIHTAVKRSYLLEKKMKTTKQNGQNEKKKGNDDHDHDIDNVDRNHTDKYARLSWFGSKRHILCLLLLLLLLLLHSYSYYTIHTYYTPVTGLVFVFAYLCCAPLGIHSFVPASLTITHNANIFILFILHYSTFLTHYYLYDEHLYLCI